MQISLTQFIFWVHLVSNNNLKFDLNDTISKINEEKFIDEDL